MNILKMFLCWCDFFLRVCCCDFM